MTADDARSESSLASFISLLPGFEVVPHLVRLIAQGQPVALEELAASAGLPVADIEGMLCDQPGTDWDSDSRIVGFGLTQRPTAHRFVVSGQSLYTWCASDALFFPALLGEAAVVESACPATGRPIGIELASQAVLSIDPPEGRHRASRRAASRRRKEQDLRSGPLLRLTRSRTRLGERAHERTRAHRERGPSNAPCVAARSSDGWSLSEQRDDSRECNSPPPENPVRSKR